jgi:tetratricopeptide (TPR) repeat protein
MEHFEPRVALELPRAEALLHELAPLPLDEQLTLARTMPVYHRWGFCQRLLFDARRSWQDDPQRALDRATVAVEVARRLDPVFYHERWVADLQAKAHAYLANAHRILGEFDAAENHFLRAEERLRHGVGMAAEGRVLSLKVSLLNDQYRYNEALALLDRVERHYERASQTDEVGRLAIKRGLVLQALDRPREAADEYARAHSLIDSELDPQASLAARQNAVYSLIQAGEVKRSRALFDALPEARESNIRLRRLWVEGDLLRAECRYDEACAAYESSRSGWAERGFHYDAALVTMDMALAAFAAGDDGLVCTCAEQSSVLLTRAAARHEAFAALRLLLMAIERRTVNRAVLEATRRKLAGLKPS